MAQKFSDETRQLAWIGDAVLALYVREWIVREFGVMDGDKAVAFSSNQFLTTLGRPTEIEAEIGRIYRRDGIAAAFAHIESMLLPPFLAQQKRRAEARPGRRAGTRSRRRRAHRPAGSRAARVEKPREPG